MAQDQTLHDRLLREAPGQWASFQKFAGRLQGSSSTEFYDLRTSRRIRSSHAWFKQAAGQELVFFESLDPQGEAKIEAVNSRYAFTLTRKPLGSAWVIHQARKVTREELLPENIGSRKNGVIRSICCRNLTLFHGKWLPDLILDPEFTINSVQVEAKGGLELAKVEFDYRPKERNDYPRQTGWMLLDPAHSWVIREYDVVAEYTDGNKNKITGMFAFQESENRHPLLTESTIRLDSIGRESEMGEYRQKYSLRLQEGVPDNEFLLSAFGLPEFNFDWQEPRASNFWPWFFGVAIIALLSGVGLAVYARRRFAASGAR